jgi:hypothetical protein
MRTFAYSLALVLVAGCANPLNRATSDDYAQTCAIAESNGKLGVTEACYRAAVNVDWGNLGPELKSESYKLARIKRRVGKLEEAEKPAQGVTSNRRRALRSNE